MSRPALTNITQTSVSSNKASDFTSLVHPSGHTLTFFGDYTIWDETTGKAILPQDLKRT